MADLRSSRESRERERERRCRLVHTLAPRIRVRARQGRVGLGFIQSWIFAHQFITDGILTNQTNHQNLQHIKNLKNIEKSYLKISQSGHKADQSKINFSLTKTNWKKNLITQKRGRPPINFLKILYFQILLKPTFYKNQYVKSWKMHWMTPCSFKS